MIVEVPAEIPVTTPVVEPMVATPVALLDHVPPEVVLVKEVVKPTHTLVVPAIAAGFGLTVKLVTAIQPVGKP